MLGLHPPCPQFVADGVFYAELNELLIRELAEDGYSGVDVRVTPLRTEIIIKATRTQNVLGRCGGGRGRVCWGVGAVQQHARPKEQAAHSLGHPAVHSAGVEQQQHAATGRERECVGALMHPLLLLSRHPPPSPTTTPHTHTTTGEKGRRIRELTSVVQKRFKFPPESVELYAEKVADRGLCAVAQAESLRYKLLGGLAVRR